MSDFVAVLKRTLDGLGETTPEMRQRVYDKARSTISAKLAAMNPPPSPLIANRQRNALEDAISEVERSFKGAAKQEPLDELEQVLNSLNGLKNQPVIAPKSLPRPAEPSRATPVAPRAVIPAPVNSPVPIQVQPSAPSYPAPPAVRKPYEEEDLNDVFLDDDEPTTVSEYEEPARIDNNRSGSLAKIGIALVLLAALAAGGYAGWVNRDRVQQMVAGLTGSETDQPAATPETPETPAAPATPEPEQPAAAEPPAGQPATEPAPTPSGPVKFTQKLNVDGSESDAGPADAGASVGEGTSMAAATPGGGTEPTPAPPAAAAPGQGSDPAPPAEGTPAATPDAAAPPAGTEPPAQSAGTTPAEPPAGTPAEPAPAAGTPAEPAPAAGTPPATEPPAAGHPAAVAVGQKAIFYEERTSSLAGSAEPGSIVWSVVQESPGAGQAPEPAIRAEATIPGKDVQLRMTIRRNADKTLPASHIIEMIFITPSNFDGGGVANVLRVALKASEQDPGAPLAGIPAKISDGFFLIALNDAQADATRNMRLLQERTWLDVPLVYNSGRRALITLEKGIPGEKVFTDVLKAWGVPTSG